VKPFDRSPCIEQDSSCGLGIFFDEGQQVFNVVEVWDWGKLCFEGNQLFLAYWMEDLINLFLQDNSGPE
jgi:hypothetical protein